MGRRNLEDLLYGVAQKQHDAFDALYKATNAKLFAVAVRILGRTDLAEEVLHDVYLKIWNRAQDYSSNFSSPMSWMVAIVRNRAIDVLRKRTESLPESSQLELSLPDDLPDPFAATVRSGELTALLNCLDALDPEYKRCFLLAYYHGYTHEEIAALTSTPVGTVKSRVRRTLARIRECMSHEQ